MYSVGDLINGTYTVDGVCSTSGGMGAVLFVSRVDKTNTSLRMVLKYCRETDDEYLRRFQRETRLLLEFAGNSKVVDIIDHDLSHDPPYYVMPYYSGGDLLSLHGQLVNDASSQERVFLQMIDCVSELHSRNTFHRDIKPQNFLQDGAYLRVADLGLSMEIDSKTAFTQTSQFGGTRGYLPPEFHLGGFKNADAASDIFMLGKSFYVLLTNRDPTYLVGNGIKDPLFHLIHKCCEIEKNRRYQSLAELKQAIVAVFDIILKRADGNVRSRNLLEAILNRLRQQNQYVADEINAFVDSLAQLDDQERKSVLMDLPPMFFQILTFDDFASRVSDFLSHYRVMVESHDYSWAFAETIAGNMKILFESQKIKDKDKLQALDLAVDGAIAMNRFAAMETCQQMIQSVQQDGLAFLVRELILSNSQTFVKDIEIVNCKHQSIVSALRELQTQS